MNNTSWCPEDQHELTEVQPAITGSVITRLRCSQCGRVYEISTPASATETEFLVEIYKPGQEDG